MVGHSSKCLKTPIILNWEGELLSYRDSHMYQVKFKTWDFTFWFTLFTMHAVPFANQLYPLNPTRSKEW